MISQKPHIFWTYYPSSRRGFWRVSPMPKPYPQFVTLWYRAHDAVLRANGEIFSHRATKYQMQYAEQLELRKTT